jgi:3-oxoacyl-[acyl-carrier protein] reductase
MAVEINLENKVALVTGGTRGIGRSIAEQLLKAGARVLATGTDEAKIQKMNDENQNSSLKYLTLNLKDSKNAEKFINEVVEKYNIDILINNAGVNVVSEAIAIDNDDFIEIQKINVHGPFLLATAFGAKMIEKKWGRIVNVASIWSIVTRSGRLSYSTSKMALLGLNKTLAVEWAKHNVLVNCVSPGFTLTELTATTNTKEELKIIEKTIPQNRLALPEEIAKCVLFLSSDLNTYITGQNIAIDGGYTAI